MINLLNNFKKLYDSIDTEHDTIYKELQTSFRPRVQFSWLERMESALKNGIKDIEEVVSSFKKFIRSNAANIANYKGQSILEYYFDEGDVEFTGINQMTIYLYEEDAAVISNSLETVNDIMSDLNNIFKIYGVEIKLTIKNADTVIYNN